jgi:hypothetical protein
LNVAEDPVEMVGNHSNRAEECYNQKQRSTGIGQIIRYFLTHPPMSHEMFRQCCYELFGIQYNKSMFTIGKYATYGPFLTLTNNMVNIHSDYQ